MSSIVDKAPFLLRSALQFEVYQRYACSLPTFLRGFGPAAKDRHISCANSKSEWFRQNELEYEALQDVPVDRGQTAKCKLQEGYNALVSCITLAEVVPTGRLKKKLVFY